VNDENVPATTPFERLPRCNRFGWPLAKSQKEGCMVDDLRAQLAAMTERASTAETNQRLLQEEFTMRVEENARVTAERDALAAWANKVRPGLKWLRNCADGNIVVSSEVLYAHTSEMVDALARLRGGK